MIRKDKWCFSALVVMLSVSGSAVAQSGQQAKISAPDIAQISAPHRAGSNLGAAQASSSTVALPQRWSALANVIALYRQGNIALADALAAKLPHRQDRLASAWAAIALQPRLAGSARLIAFLYEHRHWPARAWLRRQIEASLFLEQPDPTAVFQYFYTDPPHSPLGTMALAQGYLDAGDKAAAASLLRPLWRHARLTLWQERKFIARFKDEISAADDDARAERLTLRQDFAAGLRAAARDDKAEIALVQAGAALMRHQSAAALMAKLPAGKKASALLRYGRAANFLAQGKLDEAAAEVMGAPQDPQLLLAPDQWWRLRRQIARAMLDRHEAALAFRLCATSPATSLRQRIDSEFHAGWIALRYLNQPALALQHFAALQVLAKTPMSRARGGYWLGRALDAVGHPDQAQHAYRRAAHYADFYYGQLAAARLTSPAPRTHHTPSEAAMTPSPTIELAAIFARTGAGDLAHVLLGEDARVAKGAELRRLALYVRAQRNPTLATWIGKIADRRGRSQGTLAFPAYGLPRFVPLSDQASKPLLYAIARQESTFQPNLVSSAGARGLMQLMVATARRTAATEKLPFDEGRLTSDPAYNLQLAAAFLGLLEHEQRGSLARTLAAYNAGGGRVSQWIAAHGDPASAAVDPVDWVEAIPIDQTRNYVEHVMANVGVYRRLFGAAEASSQQIGAMPQTSQR
ncbi:MAG: lytic transglycosylase domain-containing protein [Hyphomicrobiales bacterium]|nr:lytic transglycosylase domain-containing protein [Hyphomicrobiales bacterium]